jgi:NitT/TauT family transport system permease protein
MKVFISCLKRLKYPLVVLFWFAVWHVASVLIDNTIILVSPIAAFTRLFELAAQGVFWQSVSFSLFRVITGFVLALAAGVFMAALTSRFKFLHTLTLPLFNVIKSIPVASFVLLVLFWLNSRNISLFIAFVTVLPIVYFNTYAGIKNTDAKLLEMAKVFNVSKLKTILHVYAFAVLPHIISAASTGLGFAFKSGIAAEIIGFTRGSIGFNLNAARNFLQMEDMFAWTIAIVLLSFTIEKLFMVFLKRVEKWQ